MLKNILAFLLIVGFDRITKYLVVKNQINIKITSFLEFTLVKNRGIVFGLFSNHNINIYVIIIVSILSISLISFLFFTLFHNKYSLILSVILGGAVGNIIDRYVYGYVVDFIKIDSFYVFNIADSCITVGSIFLLFVLFFGKTNEFNKI